MEGTRSAGPEPLLLAASLRSIASRTPKIPSQRGAQNNTFAGMELTHIAGDLRAFESASRDEVQRDPVPRRTRTRGPGRMNDARSAPLLSSARRFTRTSLTDLEAAMLCKP